MLQQFAALVEKKDSVLRTLQKGLRDCAFDRWKKEGGNDMYLNDLYRDKWDLSSAISNRGFPSIHLAHCPMILLSLVETDFTSTSSGYCSIVCLVAFGDSQRTSSFDRAS